jgi:pimeloyl-ACP methyl ester carboxylesterase
MSLNTKMYLNTFTTTIFFFCCILIQQSCNGLQQILPRTTTTPTTLFALTKKSQTITYDSTFVQPNVIQAGITEELCIDTANRMKRVLVPVSTSIHPTGQVGISYSYWPSVKSNKQQQQHRPAVILVHGFDSSNLEFRRLGSRLAQRGIDTYAVDLLGWGYTQLQDVVTFSASAKVEALNSFIETFVINNKKHTSFCIAGASLGGAASIEVSTINNNCKGLILIDAQGFVDGIGPMSMLPKPVAQLGVQVLKSIPLRSSANQMSYYNKELYATNEAVTIGRLHCIEQGPDWSNALVSFMQSGGFTPSQFVSKVSVPTLLLWGRQDTILDGTEFIPKFLNTIPTSTTLRWIEECGHVPHLEQPE